MRGRRWTEISVLACVALAGCSEPEVARDESEDVGHVSQAVMTNNTLSTNTLTDNALVANTLSQNTLSQNTLSQNTLSQNTLSQNTLSQNTLSQNTLSQNTLNDRTIAYDTVSTRRGHLSRELLRYIYKCAMPKDKTMTLTLDDLEHPGETEQVDFYGELGLAPEWETSACDEDCEQWVSACVLARVNGYHVKVDISLRGDHPRLGASNAEMAEYRNFEGRFWGNIFDTSTQQNHRACKGPGATLGHITGRICASNGGNCSFRVDEDCSQACPDGNTCEGMRSVEVWLKDPPPSDCGNGVCQTGEDSSECSVDCPASVSIMDHETAGHYVKVVAADAFDTDTVIYAGFTDAPTIAGLGALDPNQESSKDIFVIKAKANGTYLAARRWAAGDGDTITGVDANPENGYVAIAINNERRLLDPTTLVDLTTPELGDPEATILLDDVRAIFTTSDVPEIADPILVATLPGGVVAATNGTKTRSFIGRVASGRPYYSKPSWAWVKRFESPNPEGEVKITSAEVHGQFVVVAGEFRGPIDFADAIFSPGPDRRFGVNAKRDAFIAAYDLTTGAPHWLRSYGGPDDDDALDALTFDHSGRLWAFGTLEETRIFDSSRCFPEDCPPSIWFTNHRTAGHYVKVVAADAFDTDTVIYAGFTDAPTIAGLDYLNPNQESSKDIFVIKAQAGGRYLAARRWAAADGDKITGVDANHENGYVAVAINNERRLLDPTTLLDFTTPDVRDPDTTTVLDDVQTIFTTTGVPGIADPIRVATLPVGIVAGTDGTKTRSFIGRVAPGTPDWPYYNRPSWAWVNRLESTDPEHEVKITSAEVHGQVVVVAGEFRGPIDFAGTIPSPLPDRRLGVNANRDAFIAAYDLTTGALRWVRSYGGPGDDDALDAFTFDHSGRLWAFGTFEGTPTLEGQVAPGTDGDQGTDSMRLIVGPLPLNEQQALAVTWSGMVATRTDGTLWAWGSNYPSTLGPNGANSPWSPLPIEVPFSRAVVGTAAGSFHRLALDGAGVVWGWGDTSFGRIGYQGFYSVRLWPSPIPGLDGIVAIAAGDSHSLALRGDGKVLAFGDNLHRQLGNDAAFFNETPTVVSTLDRVVAIAAGYEHSLALRNDGTVWAWGRNLEGQLGDLTTMDRQVPVKIRLDDVTAIAAGAYHSLAVRRDGTVWGWGSNSYGQLGGNDQPTRPQQVWGLNQVLRVAGGIHHSLALKADGTVWSFGYDFSRGSYNNSPAPVSGISRAIAVACGGPSSAALLSTGDIRTWGENWYGQLGIGLSQQGRFLPARVRGPFSSQRVGIGNQAVALMKDGTIESWGQNGVEQIEDDAQHTSRPEPKRVPGISGVRSIYVNNSSAFAIKNDGSAWLLGSNNEFNENFEAYNNQELIHSPAPTRLDTNSYKILEIKQSDSLRIALTDSNRVLTWDLSYPHEDIEHGSMAISSLDGTVSIDAGSGFGLALDDLGNLKAWGKNDHGMLGDGTRIDRDQPERVRIEYDMQVVQFGAGKHFAAALTTDGQIWTWGDNSFGQLGRGRRSDDDDCYYCEYPYPISRIENENRLPFVDLAVGENHVLAIRSDDTVWAWGRNHAGQLGDGTFKDRYAPQLVLSSVGAARVYASSANSVIVTTDGSILTFGDNTYQQLGRRVSMDPTRPLKLLDIQ
ncbi:hypothetical protein WME79_15900 [Sorangium sp. So ce726]|uniref:RCC1 domain-containing protein n=1 Tax=Sorangium sp. So ce726 TaxID=3133319 RepID=UPI003F5F98F8